MPWLTSHSATNLVTLYERTDKEELTTTGDGIAPFERSITETRYEYRGMTETAADTCVTAVNDPDNGIVAVKMRSGEGGAYKVEVTTITEGAWGAV